MVRVLCVGALLLVVISCQLPPERTPLREVPNDAVALPYAELLTRARTQATTATAAFYVNKWEDLEDSARGLEQTARFLPKALEVPAKQKDTLASISADLGKEAVKLREAAKNHVVKDATETLQRVNLMVRELRLDK